MQRSSGVLRSLPILFRREDKDGMIDPVATEYIASIISPNTGKKAQP